MSQSWIKVWAEKILSSTNLQECNFTEHALFMEYLLRVRTEAKVMGKIVYPINYKPIPDKTLWTQMKLRPSLYRKAKEELLRRGIIEIDGAGAIFVRKFGELQAQIKHNSDTTTAQAQHTTIDNPLINKELDTPTEQNRTDKEEKREDNIEGLSPSSVIPIIDKPKKEYPDPNHQVKDFTVLDLIGHFGVKYKKIVGFTYPANFGKDGKIMKELLKLYTSANIYDMINLFFSSATKETTPDKPIWEADKLSIGIFRTRIPHLLIMLRERINEARKD